MKSHDGYRKPRYEMKLEGIIIQNCVNWSKAGDSSNVGIENVKTNAYYIDQITKAMVLKNDGKLGVVYFDSMVNDVSEKKIAQRTHNVWNNDRQKVHLNGVAFHNIATIWISAVIGRHVASLLLF